MTTPREEIILGSRVLAGALEPHGFVFELGQAGVSSGGAFASGSFKADSRAMEFSVRHGLGQVTYQYGNARIGHEEFLRYSGQWGVHAYRGFGSSVQQSFASLREDLINCLESFVEGREEEFIGITNLRDAEPNRFKGFGVVGRQ